MPLDPAAPPWAHELALAYESGAHGQFVLYGNVSDRFPLAGRLVGLTRYLDAQLLTGFDLVFLYDPGNGEGKDVANKEFWQTVQRQLADISNKKIKWNYVRGHNGIAGNERCDEIAVCFSTGKYIDLYDGDNAYYAFDIFETPKTEPIPDTNFKKKESTEVNYYLSLKNGVLERHKTWAECEQRVKGASGAKFKKVKSQSEEAEVLKGWGYADKK